MQQGQSEEGRLHRASKRVREMQSDHDEQPDGCHPLDEPGPHADLGVAPAFASRPFTSEDLRFHPHRRQSPISTVIEAALVAGGITRVKATAPSHTIGPASVWRT
jgi:hypothetical protein